MCRVVEVYSAQRWSEENSISFLSPHISTERWMTVDSEDGPQKQTAMPLSRLSFRCCRTCWQPCKKWEMCLSPSLSFPEKTLFVSQRLILKFVLMIPFSKASSVVSRGAVVPHTQVDRPTLSKSLIVDSSDRVIYIVIPSLCILRGKRHVRVMPQQGLTNQTCSSFRGDNPRPIFLHWPLVSEAESTYPSTKVGHLLYDKTIRTTPFLEQLAYSVSSGTSREAHFKRT